MSLDILVLTILKYDNFYYQNILLLRSTVLPELSAVSTAITTTAVLYIMYCNKLRLTLLAAKI